jgi:hypothetical protein
MAKVSLKMTKAEASAEGYGSPAEVKTPEYPWATCITLTNEVVKALWPDGLPKVGEELPLDVTAKVAGVSASDQDGGTSRVSVDLQLTDIGPCRNAKRGGNDLRRGRPQDLNPMKGRVAYAQRHRYLQRCDLPLRHAQQDQLDRRRLG